MPLVWPLTPSVSRRWQLGGRPIEERAAEQGTRQADAGAANHPGGQGTEAGAAELRQQARARAQGVLLAAAWARPRKDRWTSAALSLL